MHRNPIRENAFLYIEWRKNPIIVGPQNQQLKGTNEPSKQIGSNTKFEVAIKSTSRTHLEHMSNQQKLVGQRLLKWLHEVTKYKGLTSV